jgi:hypothetical protein
MSNPDRRRAQRIAVQQLVSVWCLETEATRSWLSLDNLSSDGVLLYADQLIRNGTQVGLIVALPPTETEAEGKRVWCLGKVLRIAFDPEQ